MTTFTETLKAGAYLVSEAAGTRSREQVTLTGGPYDAGQVLGKTLGTQTVGAASAFAGNTGNGVMGTVTGDAGAMAGDWKVVVLDPVTNAGAFEVIAPDGTVDGTGKVATAYNGGINFTLADGSQDFIAGDGFTINVSYAGGKYTIQDPAATDGSQNAVGILYEAADGSAADVQATITARDSEINKAELVWKSGATTDQKNAALAQLAALGIIGR